jgi:DNA-binding transcriptional LysR family regulator
VINLQRLDLNLLRTLDVLLSENNVTRAAQRLNCRSRRSAFSWRLREIFADPLLLPGRAACSPPPAPMNCADRCAMRSPRWSWRWRRSAFDPATAAQTWRVAATDYMASAILLPALHTLRRAPAAAWRSLSCSPRGWCSRRRDEVDLFFIPARARRRAASAPAVRERYVLAGRAGHPALRRR